MRAASCSCTAQLGKQHPSAQLSTPVSSSYVEIGIVIVVFHDAVVDLRDVPEFPSPRNRRENNLTLM